MYQVKSQSRDALVQYCSAISVSFRIAVQRRDAISAIILQCNPAKHKVQCQTFFKLPEMSEVEEKLVLRWNEFQVEALDSQREMWDKKEFTDVTLATEDDQQISSHRLILRFKVKYFSA